MTVAQYWPVGSETEGTIGFTPRDMEAHLMQDWVPSFPPLTGPALVSWPSLLTEPYSNSDGLFLALSPVAGRAERQWKSFLSWMAGVCGTRQVLWSEGYDWVAPASAFYPEGVLKVDAATPPAGFASRSLRVEADPGNPARNRPDYLAIRTDPTGKKWHLALVESKGTKDSLASKATCEPDWQQQVRNAIVSYNGDRIQPDRHLVVAVRANPNAVGGSARRFQIRAWNAEERVLDFPDDAAAELATASLYGTCLNLGLRQTAARLALANTERALVRSNSHRIEEVRTARARSTEPSRRELARRGQEPLSLPGVRLQVELAPETIEMIEMLAEPADGTEIGERLRQMTRVPAQRAGEPREDGSAEVFGLVVRAIE